MKPLPFHLLQRHPLTVRAHFAYSLVLTLALPAEPLRRVLPPGLVLDERHASGFVAIALVQTRGLHPAFLPRVFSQSFFLAGYRIFVRFRRPDGITLRGLYILRSDTDRPLMAAAGNLLTHYHYHRCDVAAALDGRVLRCQILTPDHAADLDVTADLAGAGRLPPHSPFATLRDARHYAGPLPFTFDYESQTRSIIAIKGVRHHWNPRLVPVHVGTLTFFDHGPLAGLEPRLASAFYVENIDYQWNRGVRYALAS